MSKSSNRKTAKKAARKRKQSEMAADGYESKRNSRYAKKVRNRLANPDSPFYRKG